MPYMDTTEEDPTFAAMQRAGAMGINHKWANQTWFYPNSIDCVHELKMGLPPYYPPLEKTAASVAGITAPYFITLVKIVQPDFAIETLRKHWNEWHIKQPYDKTSELNRRTMSILAVEILKPFEMEVHWDRKLER